MKKTKTKSNVLKAIAARYGRTTRTARSWLNEAPRGTFDNEATASAWLANRRHQVFKVSTPKKSAAIAAAKVTPTPDEIAGAAAALRRLERTEVQLFNDLQVALKSDDPLTIRNARTAWLAVSSELRRFDPVVEAARRDAKELVPVSDLLRVLNLILVGVEVATNHHCERLARESFAGGIGMDEFYAKYRRASVEAWTTALAGLFKEGEEAWFGKKLRDYTESQTTTDDVQIRFAVALFCEVEQAIRTGKHEPDEDEPAIARIVQRCFKRLGYETTTAPADAATATAESQPAATKDTKQ